MGVLRENIKKYFWKLLSPKGKQKKKILSN